MESRGRSEEEEKLLEDIKSVLEGLSSLKIAWDITSTTRDANGRLTQIVMTDGTTTKTIDITRDANGRIDTTDETVS